MQHKLEAAFINIGLFFCVIISLILCNLNIDSYVLFFAVGLIISLAIMVIIIYKLKNEGK